MELVLESNQITILPKNAFGTQILPDLTTLILRGNGLTSIASDAFLVGSDKAATPALQSLDLSSNQLPSIPEFPCNLMPKFSELDMHKNEFASAKFPESYSKCGLLKRITLTSNKDIKSLGKDDFQYLKAKNLRLELGNDVSTVDQDAFTPVKPLLTTLGLSENPIGFDGLKNALTALNGAPVLASLHLNALHGDGLNGSIFSLLENFSAPALKSVAINNNPVYALSGAISGDLRSLTGFECDSCLLEKVDDVFKSGAITQFNRAMLQRNRLTSVPSALPSTLQFLYLDGNPIAKLSTDLKGYPLLQELGLSNTPLKSVAIDSFSGLSKLRKLILTNASLSDAVLTSGGNSLFAGLAALKTLTLSGNAIAKLADAALFADLKKLTSLALDAQITADKLGLTAIDPQVFAPLAALTTLSLSGNAGFGSKQVASDTQGALLRNLSKLASLSLGGCGISSIPQAYFSGVASSLTTLSLSYNAIPVATLTDGALASLKNLMTLHLSNSTLAYVPRKVFAQWPQLQEVDLRNNPFHCDSNLNELHDWLQTVTQTFTLPDAQSPFFTPSPTEMLVLGYRSYVCVSPPTCANVKLADTAFSAHLAECTSGKKTTTTASAPSTPKSPTGAPKYTSSRIPEVSSASNAWLVLLLVFGVLILAAGGGVGGWWYLRRRRGGYYPIDAPIHA